MVGSTVSNVDEKKNINLLKYENGMHINFHQRRKWSIREFTQRNKIIRILALMHDVKMVRNIRNANFKGWKESYFTPVLETTALEDALYRGTTFEYEESDWLFELTSKILQYSYDNYIEWIIIKGCTYVATLIIHIRILSKFMLTYKK